MRSFQSCNKIITRRIWKGIWFAKMATGYWEQQNSFYWFKVRWMYNEEDHTMNTRNILCQPTVDSIPNELFSQCFQFSLSICQTLLSPQTSETWLLQDSIPRMPLINFHPPISPFRVFNPSPLLVKPPLSGFQLDLYLSFSFSFFVV